MKKSLLFIAISFLSIGANAQIVPSPFWTNQSANYPNVSTGTQWFDAIDANNVWALGYNGTLPNANFNDYTRTNNGGTTYTAGLVYPDTLTYHPSSIEGIDPTTAWVTSYLNTTLNKGAIHTTTNGGVTWTNMTAVNMYTNNTSWADFTAFCTATVGITLGDPVSGEFEIHRTTNGGATWSAVAGTAIPNPLGGEYGITDLYTKFGANDIWFGTNLGRIYHSSNQGQSWTVASVIGGSYITKIAFRSALNGIAYTNNAGSPAFTSTNGGISWTAITPIDPNMGKNAICVIPGTNMYASCGAGVGNNVISYSTDDGLTWNNWGGANVQYLEIEFVSNSVGFAGGFSDPGTPGLDGMFKYSGVPLGVSTVGIPYSSLEMYPNPSTGIVTIDLQPTKEGGSLFVIDAMGKTVYSENIRNVSFEKHNLNLENLAKGIYSVNIVRAGRTESKKIVIQ